MNRDDIIRMAREVWEEGTVDPFSNGYWTLTQQELERFAAKAYAEGVKAEREAIMDEWFRVQSDLENGVRLLSEQAAIRARGEKE